MQNQLDINKLTRSTITYYKSAKNSPTGMFSITSHEADTTRTRFYSYDYTKETLSVMLSPKKLPQILGTPQDMTTYGDLFECACNIEFNRLSLNNSRQIYETAIIDWCASNNKKSVNILSFGAGGLLQEMILGKSLAKLGINASFIAVDSNYKPSNDLKKIREEQLQHGYDNNNFYEWMLHPYMPILSYQLLCDKAIAQFKQIFPLQTFCGIGDLSLALQHKMVAMPDLVITIDTLAFVRGPVDTRHAEQVPFLYPFCGEIGDKKYKVIYNSSDTSCWGWYNFAVMLASSGLLKNNPTLPAIVYDFSTLKWFSGVNEVKCNIKKADGSFSSIGINDNAIETVIISESDLALMPQQNRSHYSFPRRAILSWGIESSQHLLEENTGCACHRQLEDGHELHEYEDLILVKRSLNKAKAESNLTVELALITDAPEPLIFSPPVTRKQTKLEAEILKPSNEMQALYATRNLMR